MFLYLSMCRSINKTVILISLALIVTFSVRKSFAADSEEFKQRLEQLQKSLQNLSPNGPREEPEKGLKPPELPVKEEGVTESGGKGIEEKLKILKSQIPQVAKTDTSHEEATLAAKDKRFFIEGRYWLSSIIGVDKEAASLYSISTKQPVGTIQNTTPYPISSFVVSGGVRHSPERATLVKLWRLESSSSTSQSATPSVGISGTEGSDYYYQNIKQWGTATFATKGVDRVDTDSRTNETVFDLLHTVSIGKSGDTEAGGIFGLRYAQFDSSYAIRYSSTTSQLYSIKSDVENTLIGPVFGIYGSGVLTRKLRLKGLFDVSVMWDHVKARRFEYDNTTPQTALDAGQAKDIAVTAINSELGISYPFGQSLSFGLDYKAAYFGGLPFELKSAGIFLNTPELYKRDILTHGLTAGITYSF